jgi:hypothetical protein
VLTPDNFSDSVILRINLHDASPALPLYGAALSPTSSGAAPVQTIDIMAVLLIASLFSTLGDVL